jgi:hypothetical protein
MLCGRVRERRGQGSLLARHGGRSLATWQGMPIVRFTKVGLVIVVKGQSQGRFNGFGQGRPSRLGQGRTCRCGQGRPSRLGQGRPCRCDQK